MKSGNRRNTTNTRTNTTHHESTIIDKTINNTASHRGILSNSNDTTSHEPTDIYYHSNTTTNNDTDNKPATTMTDTVTENNGEERREFYNQRRRQKQQGVEVVVDLILKQLADPQVRESPLATLSCLFTFKSLFQKSPKPSLLKQCCKQGMLSVLMDVLEDSAGKGPPSHHTTEVWVQPVLCQVVVEILWLFSSVCLAHPHHYRSLGLLKPPLLSLLSSLTHPHGPFFHFSPLFSRTLNRLCRDVPFPAQSFSCVAMTQQAWDSLVWHQPWMSAYRGHLCLYLCSLTPHTTPTATPTGTATGTATPTGTPTGTMPSPTIATHLIRQGLAWPPLPQSSLPAQPTVADPPLPGGSTSGDLWCGDRDDRGGGVSKSGDGGGGGCEDVIFLNAIGGAYFWAYVGGNSVQTVNRIAQLLRSELPSLKTFHPLIGDAVIVTGGEEEADMLNVVATTTEEGDVSNAVTELEESDTSTEKGKMADVMRGRAIDVSEEEVTVFVVDYGKVVKVKAECVYRPSRRARELAGMEPQAKLCRLAGVQPPPVSEGALELALCFLTNITKNYSNTGLCLKQTGGLVAICRLMQVAPPTIRLQALRLMANMAAMPAVTRDVDCSPLIPPLLESLDRRRGGGMEKKTWVYSVVATLQVISNILHCKPCCRDLFFQLQGQVCILRVMQWHRHGKQSHAILKAASCSLRAAFSGLMKTSADNLPCLPELAGEESGDRKEKTQLGEEEEDAEQEWTEGTTEKPRRASGKPRRASGKPRRASGKPRAAEKPRASEKPRRAPEKPRASETHRVPDKPRRAPGKPRVSEEPRASETPRAAAETHGSQRTTPEEDWSQSTTPELWTEGADINDDNEEEEESSEEGRWKCFVQDRTPTRLMSRHYLKQEAQKLRTGQERGKSGCGKAATSNRNDDDDNDDDDNDDREDNTGQESTEASHRHRHHHHHRLLTPNVSRRQSDSSSGLADVLEDWERLPTAATATSDLCAANDGSVRPDDGSYYEFNSYVAFEEDSRHHFMDVDDLSSISHDLLTQLITAMLNSEGGRVYLGLSSGGQVQGVCVGREDREHVRMAVDEVMGRCHPVVPHTLLHLTYLPVLRLCGDDDSSSDGTAAVLLTPCQDRFVIEIEVKRPGDRVLYAVTQGKDKVSWRRCGVHNLPLTEQEVREMVVKEEERSYLPLIHDLEQRLRHCQQRVTSTDCTPPL